MTIKFSVCAEVVSVSIREKDDSLKYAVVKVSYRGRGRFHEANLMCFSDFIWENLKENCVYEFDGIVVPQKGNTFLSITKSTFKFDPIPF